MNKTIQAAVAASLLAGLSQGARADLDLTGEVGLPLNPTAQIPLQGGVRVQGDYADLRQVGPLKFKYYGLHGAGRVANNIEINGGVDHINASGIAGLDNTGVSIGAKYLFTRETDPAGVRIAAGAGYSRVLLKNYHAYLVGTKYLGTVTQGQVPITGHLGVRYDHFSLSDIGGGTSSKASVYGGVEVPITRQGNFSFVGELQSKNTKFGNGAPYSASVRFRPAGQGFSASIGVVRQGIFTNRAGLLLQAGYSFDTSQITGTGGNR